MDLVPNHTSSAHPWFAEALAADPAARAGPLHLPRRASAGRPQPPNNWLSVFGGPAWTRVPDGAVVPAPVRPRAARPELGQPRGLRRPREDAAVLAGPRRRRVPHRRRARHGQAARPAGHGARPTTGLLRSTTPTTRGSTTTACTRSTACIRRVLDDYPDAVTVGEIWVHDNERLRQVPAPRRAAPGVQLPARAGRLRRRRDPGGDRQLAGGRRPRPARHRPGRCPTTTCAREVTRYGGGAARAGAGPGDGAGEARAARRRSSSTTATNSGCPTSTCPTRSCRTRSGSGRGTPNAAATAAGCRCRGAATEPPFGVLVDTRHLAADARRTGRRLTVERQLADPDSMLSLYRRAIGLRTGRAEFDGDESMDVRSVVSAFRLPGGLICALNAGDHAGRAARRARCCCASGPLVGGKLAARHRGLAGVISAR